MPDIDAVISHSTCPVTGSACEDVVVRRGSSGRVQSLYGQDVAIDLAAIGCATSDVPEDQVRCFLSQFGEVFGASEQEAELQARDTTTLQSGATVVLFDQVSSGLRSGRHRLPAARVREILSDITTE
jgi:hypothetical protein